MFSLPPLASGLCLRACVQNRMSHLMGAVAAAGEPEGELDGSFCFWDHDGEPLKPSPLRGLGTPARSRRAQPLGQPRLRLGFDQGSGADDALAAESITAGNGRPSALEQPGLGSLQGSGVRDGPAVGPAAEAGRSSGLSGGRGSVGPANSGKGC